MSTLHPATPEFGCDITLDRRRLLLSGGASLAMWALLPRGVHAAARDPRLLTIVLRGGMDGLTLLAPTGDPDYARLRERLALPAGSAGTGTALGNFFTLNGNMPFLASLYGRKQAIIAHAIASPYRGRSHFDGQDVLESGLGGVGKTDTGWLNRAFAGLPAAAAPASRKGLSIGPIVPLVMRGPAPVLTWVPKVYEVGLQASTIDRLRNLYAASDEGLLKALTEGLAAESIAGAPAPKATGSGSGMDATPAMAARLHRDFITTAEAAAKFMASPDGPRLGALSYNGWDTHANQGPADGQLGRHLAALDGAIKTLHDGLGAAWKETVVVVVTEFGRTVRVNGTAGTDHGTATTALIVGGAVKGGRVIADWPGLKESALYENRDLMPTRDLRALLKGVLQDHLGVPAGALASSVFPDSAAVAPMRDLIG